MSASTADGSDRTSVSAWLVRCLGREDIAVHSAPEIGQGKSSRVWDCSVDFLGTDMAGVVLKVYEPKCRDYTGLAPARVASKHALALQELRELGLPVPRLLGTALYGADAALVTEKVNASAWSRDTRVEAARVLARLHAVEVDDLSAELADLVTTSPPNRGRILNGVRGMAEHLDASRPGWRASHPRTSTLLEAVTAVEEPAADEQVLVHGDYFSVNILATPTGVCVVDWDLLSLGDPMWDLGFLVSADRGVTEDEAAAVIATYRALQPVPECRLQWNRDCWETFWRLRELCESADA